MIRRNFIRKTSILSSGILLNQYILKAVTKKNPVIMIVSGWQDVNIGDIAHTPGLLALMTKRLPGASFILWKKGESKMVDEMLLKYFPTLRIVHGKINKDNLPESDEVIKAFAEADYFIHGSGPSVVAADYLRCWQLQTGKPFGIFGVTIQDVTPELSTLLSKARFIFTRETASVGVLKKAGISGDHIAFAPDATFALNIHDTDKAGEFMVSHQLEKKKFICVIPRLRLTPYYKIKPGLGWSEQKIKDTDELNDKFKEADHAKLREAMITWVRKTGNKILVCPEMTYQVDIMDELLINPLPSDVKPFVIKRGYWLPDEAASVYENAHTVLSCECHSPIIAIVNGTPAFYLRQPQDTIKGQMYYDLGFSDWVFEIENTTGLQIAERLMQVYDNYPAARQNVTDSLDKVKIRYDVAFKIVRGIMEKANV